MAATLKKHARRIAFPYGEAAAARAPSQPDWLTRLRAEARAVIADGLPSPHVEAWKYTNLQPLAERRFAVVGDVSQDVVRRGLEKAALGRSAYRLVFVNGRLESGLSELGNLPKGVVISGLADAMAADSSAFAGRIGRSEVVRGHALAAYNTAFFADGVLITLEPGVVLDRPVHLIFIGVAGSSPIAFHPRLIIEAGAGSQITLIESHIGETGAYWANPVTEITVGQDAVVRQAKLQDETMAAHHLALVDVSVAKGGQYDSTVLTLGAALSRHEINVRLEGEHAEARLNGGYLIGGKQLCDNTTRIEHLVPHGSCREVYKGVLDDEARGAFQGTIIVHKGAVKTNAHQLCRAMMLSKGAEANAKPELEIYADDVKCSHGASAGAIDPMQMFYLRARGLDEATARALLVEGFIGETIEGIADEAVRAYFALRIAHWLESHARGPA